MLRVFLIFFLCATLYSEAQVSASRYEKRWALAHPFAALKVRKITKACFVIYNQPEIMLQLDTFSNGGRLDAFRHTFFMAAYAQKIKSKKLLKLGIAHEKANYRQFLHDQTEDHERPDSLSSVMDLKNNALGVAIGRTHKALSHDELKQLAIAEIKAGKAFIMRRNKSGQYVDCDGRVIDLNRNSRTWFVPKCLVASL